MAANWPEIRLNDWSHFQEIINDTLGVDSWMPEWFFRGQSNSEWTLQSGLNRILQRNNIYDPNIAFLFEQTTIREFASKSHLFDNFHTKGYGYNSGPAFWLIAMQHYGCPTRLLDWTYSPYNALYFAVSSNFEVDGAIFCFNENILSNPKNTPEIPSEKVLEIEHINLDYLAAFLPSLQNNRSNFQQGCFTLNTNPVLDHQDSIYNKLFHKITDNATPFVKIIIPFEIKLSILKKLKSINVRADILYPDLFGLSQYLKDLIEIRANQYKT